MSIKVKDITHTYFKKTLNEVLALDHVSLSIEKGEFVALVGETGSGKSTLVQHLNALLLPDTGTLEIEQYIITPNKRKNKHMHDLRSHIGLIFQFPEYQLFEETVLKDVAFGPRNFGLKEEEAKEKAKRALEMVHIDESYYERSPFELSGGERRRVAIAGILAIDPEILVLDEPTAGLDYQGSIDIMNLVHELNVAGKTIVLVTHDMDIVHKYASRTILLEGGKVIFDGTPFDLFMKYGDNLELPHLFKFAYRLNEKGFSIPLDKVSSIEDVFKYIRK